VQPATRRLVWCGRRGIVHDLEMIFKHELPYIPHFFVLLLSQSFTQALALYQRFTALEVVEQRPVTLF